jgi:hypothetical protein
MNPGAVRARRVVDQLLAVAALSALLSATHPPALTTLLSAARPASLPALSALLSALSGLPAALAALLSAAHPASLSALSARAGLLPASLPALSGLPAALAALLPTAHPALSALAGLAGLLPAALAAGLRPDVGLLLVPLRIRFVRHGVIPLRGRSVLQKPYAFLAAVGGPATFPPGKK